MAQEIHQGDVGTVFVYTFVDEDGAAIDLTQAESGSPTVRFERPDQTTFDRDIELSSDAASGIGYYTSVAGDLDQNGRWRTQGSVTTGAGSWKSDVHTFKVYPNLADPS